MKSTLGPLFQTALNAMGVKPSDQGPQPVTDMLKALASIQRRTVDDVELDKLWDQVLGEDVNDPLQLMFGRALRRWDSFDMADWTASTEPRSSDRRKLVYKLLNLDDAKCEGSDRRFPVAHPTDSNIVIASDHEEWYTGARESQRSFYWDAYSCYLETVAGWEEDGVRHLGDSARQIVERLSDPQREAIFQTKGLVVGYVQSGKTANFTAVAARAADAGYRLIIILAGTLNILREQTQRRLDKELIGKELIRVHAGPDRQPEYFEDNDWKHFIEHSDLPSRLGAFDWERLTSSTDDYQHLRQGISALEAQCTVPGRRFNDPVNLHVAPVRLIVVKKNTQVLKKLNHDLTRLKTSLDDVPALIIDDESDQASINTNKPTKSEVKKRTETNLQIVRLLRILPRSQYVGYTATPFANVFVDPNDSEDLFPKDYMIALRRPDGYMGVSDFFDLDENGRSIPESDLPDGYLSKQKAFVRDILDEDRDTKNLPKAIHSFVLSGALKLYRSSNGVHMPTRHHTMLVHTSTRQADHEQDRKMVEDLFTDACYGSQKSYELLSQLWSTDFLPVSKAQASTMPAPKTFAELKPFVDECLSRIQQGGKPVMIVNGDKKYEDELPNFDRDSVWSILIGGAKLSRGYTVEGLTVSYYRRKIKQADTLMQVGRWFGFRRNYRDLVRLFIGRREQDGKNKTIDLYEAFKAICQDEEAFRKELRKYADPNRVPRLTPSQIPPLVPSHLLPPTSKNKMYNAQVAFQNYRAEWVEPTLATDKDADRKHNAEAMKSLLQSGKNLGVKEFVFTPDEAGKKIEWSANVSRIGTNSMNKFFEDYRWLDSRPLLVRHLDFLRGTGVKDPQIDHWLIVSPQLKTSISGKWGPGSEFTVASRSRIDSGSKRFKAFSEPRHRIVAEYLAGLRNLASVSEALKELLESRTAVMLLYPTIEKSDAEQSKPNELIADRKITIGFGLQFPDNDIPTPITFSVRDPARPDAVVVTG